jgi:Ser/Thr protein kinase RdoA (MazF antagonist)
VLAPGAVAALVSEHYGLEVRECELLRSLVNDVYAVNTSIGRYAFKLYRQEHAPRSRSWTEVGWEQELAHALLGAGLSVPVPVELVDGTAVGRHAAPEGPRPFVLTRWVKGSKPLSPFTDELYRTFGALTARFHTAASSSAPARHRAGPDPVEDLQPTAAVVAERLHPTDAALVREQAEGAAAHLDRLTGPGLTWGVRHGDVTLDNVLIVSGGLVLHDFDRAGSGWLAADLTGVRATEQWPAFLNGYREHRRLTSADLEAIAPLQVVALVANLRFHLVDKAALFGTETRGDGWVERELGSLRDLAERSG